jgi:hypothetical protein
MKSRKKTIDAVSMMRKIRDKLSSRFSEMPFEEETRQIREQLEQMQENQVPPRKRVRKSA